MLFAKACVSKTFASLGAKDRVAKRSFGGVLELAPLGLALIRIVCEARRARALVRALFLTKSVILIQI